MRTERKLRQKMDLGRLTRAALRRRLRWCDLARD